MKKSKKLAKKLAKKFAAPVFVVGLVAPLMFGGIAEATATVSVATYNTNPLHSDYTSGNLVLFNGGGSDELNTIGTKISDNVTSLTIGKSLNTGTVYSTADYVRNGKDLSVYTDTTLVLTSGGNITSTIKGGGTVLLDTNMSVDADLFTADFCGVTVDTGYTLTLTGDAEGNNTLTKIIDNRGTIVLNGATLGGQCVNNGTLKFAAATTVANASYISTATNIVNDGVTLKLQGGELKGTLGGESASGTGKVEIGGNVSAHAECFASTLGGVTVNAGKTLTLTAPSVTYSELGAVVSGYSDSNLTISGKAKTDAANIKDFLGKITVESSGGLSLSGGTLTRAISNSGTVTLNGATLGGPCVTGGTLKFDAASTTVTDASYIAADVNILGSEQGKTLTLTGGTLTKDIKYDGSNSKVVLNGATLGAKVGLRSDGSGSSVGTLEFAANTTVKDASYIAAYTNTIDSGMTVTLQGGTSGIATLGGTLSGAGNITIGNGTAASTVVATVAQLGNTGTLSVAENGTLELTGGELTKDISNSGKVKINTTNTTDTLTISSTGSIGEGTVEVAKGLLVYQRTGKIADTLTIAPNAGLDPAPETLAANTTNNGRLWLKDGTLSVNIGGTAGTTYLKSAPNTTEGTTLTVNKDETIAGTLNGSGNVTNVKGGTDVANTTAGTIDMTGGSGSNQYTTLTVGKLAGTTNLKIDLDMSNVANVDKLSVGAAESGAALNLSDITITKDYVPTAGGTMDMSATGEITVVTGAGAGNITYTVGSTAASKNSLATNDYIYTFANGDTKGNLKYTISATDVTLQKFLEGTLGDGTNDPAALNLTANINNTATAINVGATTQANNTLTIKLNDKNLTSSSNSTITVENGKTLKIEGNGGSADSKTGFDVKAGTVLAFSGTATINGVIANAATEGITVAGNVTTAGAISGDGSLKISGGTLTAKASVQQGAGIILAGANDKLIISVDNLNSVVTNFGILELTEGTLMNGITNDANGTVKLKGATLGAKVVTTGTLEFAADTTVANASYIAATTNKVDSETTLTLTAGTLGGTLSGDGKVVVDGTVSADADLFTQTGGLEVKDSGDILTLTGGSAADPVVLGEAVTGAGSMKIGTGDVAAYVSADADKIGVATEIVKSDSVLTLTGGSAAAPVVLGKAVTGKGSMKIGTNSVAAYVSASANKIGVATEVVNSDSVLTLTGGSGATPEILYGSVSGAGKVVVNGDVSANANQFAQTGGLEINVNKSLTLTAGPLSKEVTNNGTLKVAGDVQANVYNSGTVELSAGTLSANITGTGTTVITGAVTATVKAAQGIQQNISVDSTGTLNVTDAALSKDIANGGTLNLSGTTTLTTDITGSGTINLAANGTLDTSENGVKTVSLGSNTLNLGTGSTLKIDAVIGSNGITLDNFALGSATGTIALAFKPTGTETAEWTTEEQTVTLITGDCSDITFNAAEFEYGDFSYEFTQQTADTSGLTLKVTQTTGLASVIAKADGKSLYTFDKDETLKKDLGTLNSKPGTGTKRTSLTIDGAGHTLNAGKKKAGVTIGNGANDELIVKNLIISGFTKFADNSGKLTLQDVTFTGTTGTADVVNNKTGVITIGGTVTLDKGIDNEGTLNLEDVTFTGTTGTADVVNYTNGVVNIGGTVILDKGIYNEGKVIVGEGDVLKGEVRGTGTLDIEGNAEIDAPVVNNDIDVKEGKEVSIGSGTEVKDVSVGSESIVINESSQLVVQSVYDKESNKGKVVMKDNVTITGHENGVLRVKNGSFLEYKGANESIKAENNKTFGVIVETNAVLDPCVSVFAEGVNVQVEYDGSIGSTPGNLILTPGVLYANIKQQAGSMITVDANNLLNDSTKVRTTFLTGVDQASQLDVKEGTLVVKDAEAWDYFELVSGDAVTNGTLTGDSLWKSVNDVTDANGNRIFVGEYDVQDGKITLEYRNIPLAVEGNTSALAGVQQGAISMVNQIADVVGDNVGLMARPAKTEGAYEKTIWANYINSKETVEGMPIWRGSGDNTAKYHGVTLGADFYTSKKAIAGVALTYVTGDVNNYAASTVTNNKTKYYGISLYDRVTNGKSAWTYDLGYSQGKNEITQNSYQTITADAKTNAYTIGAKYEYACNFKHSSLVPFASLRYLRLNSNDYSNSNGHNMSINSQNLIIPKLGLAWTGDFSMPKSDWNFKPLVEVGYIWNLKGREADGTFTSRNRAYDIAYDTADKSSYYTKLGLNFSCKKFMGGVSYHYAKGDSVRNNKWNINASWAF